MLLAGFVLSDSQSPSDSAHGVHAGRWGVTLGDDFLRLNVGPLEALWWVDDMLEVMVDVATAKQDGGRRLLRELPGVSQGIYRSVPSSAYVGLPLEDSTFLSDCMKTLARAHRVHIALACRAGLNGMTRRGHHPGIIEAIGRTAGRALPQPEYVRPELHVRTSDVEVETFLEGSKRETSQTKYERSAAARRACLLQYGTSCTVCGLNFGAAYAPEVTRLIEVHHIIPLATGKERNTNPTADLRPVCPNCHAVIHSATPPRSLEEVRVMLGTKQ